MPFGSDATGKGQLLPLMLLRKPCPSRVFIQQRHIVPHDVARRETAKHPATVYVAPQPF